MRDGAFRKRAFPMTGIFGAVTVAACSIWMQQAAAATPDTIARGAEQAVLATYRKMEEADRKGNGALWLALRDRATLNSMNEALKETIRKGGHSRPSIRYEALTTRAAGGRSVILGKVTDPAANTVQYDVVLFVLEDTEWKVASEQLDDKPFDPFVLWAMLEPADGPFTRDGTPWRLLAYASPNGAVVHKEDLLWKVRATVDESFLYVRFESAQVLPAAGAKLRPNVGKAGATGGPPPPPAMRIKNEGVEVYSISVNPLVSSAAAVDAKGRPATDHYSVGYTLAVRKNDGEQIYSATIGENSHSYLLAVRDHFIDVRIPVGGLGGEPGTAPKLDLEDADPANRILPYHVETYPRQ
jgi:hypothetical protein